jgi:ABC-type Fe3+-siderophore transport system permease subunit
MLYGLTFVGGLIVFLAPFTGGWRGRPRWSRVALWLMGSAVTAWTILGVLLVYRVISLSPITRDLLFAIKNMLSGLALGQLLVLLFAGGFSRLPSALKSQRESEGEKKT